MNQAQRDEIKKTSLARVICDNADDIEEIPEDAFRAAPWRLTSCHRIPGINFKFWSEDVPCDPHNRNDYYDDFSEGSGCP